MRLLFIHTLYSPHVGGGAELILQEHAEQLAKRGHSVGVLTTGPEPGLAAEERGGVRVFRAGIENLYWHFTQARPNPLVRAAWHWRDRYNESMRKYVREVIKTERPDVVICHNLGGWSISAWDEVTAHRLPIVQVIHDLYLVCARSNMFRSGKACEEQCAVCSVLRSRHVEASRQIAAVVGVSHYVLDRLSGFGLFRGVSQSVVHNAREIPDPGLRTGVSSDAPLRFGYIGTLDKAKGLEWLIEQFRTEGSGATMTIAGKGQIAYETRLRALADSGNIRFVGYMESREFYSSIDVCIVPSIWPDTFPGVAYEACAHHVPVIASRVGGLPEIIREGVNGILCNPKDRSSLGNAMRRVREDRALLKRFAENARQSVAEMLDIERVHSQYEALYRKVAGVS
jgi:glycosyltransferase involved in cell wall biosynthesis